MYGECFSVIFLSEFVLVCNFCLCICVQEDEYLCYGWKVPDAELYIGMCCCEYSFNCTVIRIFKFFRILLYSHVIPLISSNKVYSNEVTQASIKHRCGAVFRCCYGNSAAGSVYANLKI